MADYEGFRPVGVDKDGRFPERVEQALSSTIGDAVDEALGGGGSDILRAVDSETAPTTPGVYWITDRADTTPPSIPADLDAVASASGIALSWSPSVDDSGAIGEYRVYRDGTLLAVPLTTFYTDSTAAWGTEYDYSVSAVDPFDNESAQSAPVAAVKGVPGEPSIPQTNLIAHFRASDLALADGATVTSWENRISDGADFAATGAPAFEAGTVRPCVVFDGVDDGMTATTGIIAQPCVRILVGRVLTPAGSKTLMGGTNSGSNRQVLSINTGNTQFAVYSGSATRDSGVPVDTNLHVMAVRYEAATSRIVIDSAGTTISSPGAEAGENLRIARNSTGASYTHMEVYEVAVYAGTLSDAAIAEIVGDLMDWYDI